MGNPLEEKISINNLISGFANYLQTLKAIAQKPLSFPDGLDLSAEGAFQQALAFMFYSLVLMFFILIPIFSKYGVEVSKVTFLLRFLIQFGIYTLMLHLSLKLFGASRSLKQTAVVYWHIIGFGAPLFLILVYPMLLVFQKPWPKKMARCISRGDGWNFCDLATRSDVKPVIS